MSKRNGLKINIAASWAAHAVTLLVGVLLMPWVLRTLGDHSYGVWIFINSIAGYSGLLYLGLGQTICRYVAAAEARRDWDGLNRIVNVVLAAYLALGGFAFVASLGLAWIAPSLNDWGGGSLLEIRLVILILGLSIALGMAGSVFGGILAGMQRFDIDRGICIVSGLARLALTIAFLSAEYGLLKLALIYLAVTVLENAANLAYASREVKTLSLGWRWIDRATLRECFSFSSYAFLNVIAYQVFELTDTVIIGTVLGVESTVPYFIAQRLCKLIGRPMQAVGQVFMPRAGELHERSGLAELQLLATRGTGGCLLLMAGFTIGAAFFGDDLIATWVGPGYEQSYALLMVLLVAQTIATPVEVVHRVLFGMGQVRLPAIVYLLEAVSNLTLSLVLIHVWGLMGVAVGTLTPVLAFELFLLLPYAGRVLQISAGRMFREALAPQILPLGALLAYSMTVSNYVQVAHGWLPLLAIAAGGGAVLLAAWFGQQRFVEYLTRDLAHAGRSAVLEETRR